MALQKEDMKENIMQYLKEIVKEYEKNMSVLYIKDWRYKIAFDSTCLQDVKNFTKNLPRIRECLT